MSIPILQGCFTPEEWEWLSKQEAFQVTLKRVKDLTDVEPAAKLGRNLIRLAEHDEKRSARSSLPPGRR